MCRACVWLAALVRALCVSFSGVLRAHAVGGLLLFLLLVGIPLGQLLLISSSYSNSIHIKLSFVATEHALNNSSSIFPCQPCIQIFKVLVHLDSVAFKMSRLNSFSICKGKLVCMATMKAIRVSTNTRVLTARKSR